MISFFISLFMSETGSSSLSGKKSRGLTSSARAMRMSVIADGSFLPVSMLAMKLCDISARMESSNCDNFFEFRMLRIDLATYPSISSFVI